MLFLFVYAQDMSGDLFMFSCIIIAFCALMLHMQCLLQLFWLQYSAAEMVIIMPMNIYLLRFAL